MPPGMWPSTAAPVTANILPPKSPGHCENEYAASCWLPRMRFNPLAVTGMFFGAATVPLVRL